MRRIEAGDDEERAPVDWLGMEQRLRKIEDALIDMRTVTNLLLDLLERVLPCIDDDKQTEWIGDVDDEN